MRVLVGALVIVAGIASGWNVTRVSSEISPVVREAGLEAGEESAGASLLGQVKTSGAGWLYGQTDLYLHNGVELRPITPEEVRAGQKGVGIKRGEKQIMGDESHLVTAVPSADRDFRGVFGDIERETSAYKDMTHHSHNSPVATLPLFRLMTWIDPQFITGWSTGGTILESDGSNIGVRKALEFLKEGLYNNPDSIDLLTQVGSIVAFRLKNTAEGVDWLEKARKVGYAERAHLDETDRTSLEQTYSWLAICYATLKDRAKLKDAVSEGLTIFKDNKVLLHYALELGLPVEIPENG